MSALCHVIGLRKRYIYIYFRGWEGGVGGQWVNAILVLTPSIRTITEIIKNVENNACFT